jgi:ABC-type uncharacterized transport system permease subunit
MERFSKGMPSLTRLVASTPLIFTGLALALGFRGGVFNIGAAGQFLIGATCGVFVGYAMPLPPAIHSLAALLAGAIGGFMGSNSWLSQSPFRVS